MHNPPPTIDPLADDLLTDAKVGKLLGVSPATVWRYRVKGKRGVRLPAIPWGRGAATTRDCIRWFYAELQHRQAEASEPKPHPRAISAELEAECRRLGI